MHILQSLSHLSIRGLATDSRQVVPGGVFFAYPGTVTDGRRYIAEAIQRGAAAVVYDSSDLYPIDVHVNASASVLFFPTAEIRAVLGEVARHFFGDPSRDLTIIGVTGTNGKTSVSHFIAQILPDCAVLGTLGNGRLGHLQSSRHTTLDVIALQTLLQTFRNTGIKNVAMEVSSHALDQSRIAGVRIDTAVFTHISRDHLDYHGTMQAYSAAKASLFTHPGLQRAVINADDRLGRELITQHHSHLDIISYAIENDARVSDRFLTARSIAGSRVLLDTSWGEAELSMSLLGRFNVSNVLAVLGVLLHHGVTFSDALAACSRLQPVRGRMQCLGGGPAHPHVVVDYAHTPDALEKVLRVLRETATGQLWCVFGCGGDRDRGKRAMMGAKAAHLADRIIVTSDNPRSESPQQIANDIIAGMQDTKQVWVILDRAEAILFALENARENDTVLLAGKGHETTQIIGNTVLAFDDVQHVSAWLGER